MEKYYYQKGRCQANGYLSLNPILYESTEENGKFKKVKMACNCVQKGECNKEVTCQLLQDAPELVIDDKINLIDKKL